MTNWLDLQQLPGWWAISFPSLQNLLSIIFFAFIAAHYKPFHLAVQQKQSQWLSRLIMIGVLGGLTILSTRFSILLEIGNDLKDLDVKAKIPEKLNENQVIIGFRNTLLLVAGLVGGWWVGFGVGLMAGIHRYFLGGAAGTSSCVIGILLGVLAGIVKDCRPQWIDNYKGSYWVLRMR